MNQLVLSLFPGAGLLDMAFEEEGFCVVEARDLILGGDHRRFTCPPHRFDGVIGGPPCQRFSRLVNVVRAVHGEGSVAPNLIPEFERIVGEAQPDWFLMENVWAAPVPVVPGYTVHNYLLNNRECDRGDGVGPEQNRVRRFSFGTRDGRELDIIANAKPNPVWEPACCSTAGGRRVPVKLRAGCVPKGKQGKGPSAGLRNRTLAEDCVLQGLPPDFLKNVGVLKARGKRIIVANGVPLPMGRAVAKAVKRAMELDGVALRIAA